MAIFSAIANQLLPLTTALSGVTLAVGLCACPMYSLTLQHAFVFLSVVTVAGAAASFVWYVHRPVPYERRFKVGLGMIPFALFWGFLLSPCETIREYSGRNLMASNGKNTGFAIHSFHDANRRLPGDIRDAANAPILSWRVSVCPYNDAPEL
jgi:hypothetical protein